MGSARAHAFKLRFEFDQILSTTIGMNAAP